MIELQTAKGLRFAISAAAAHGLELLIAALNDEPSDDPKVPALIASVSMDNREGYGFGAFRKSDLTQSSDVLDVFEYGKHRVYVIMSHDKYLRLTKASLDVRSGVLVPI